MTAFISICMETPIFTCRNNGFAISRNLLLSTFGWYEETHFKDYEKDKEKFCKNNARL